VLYLIILRVEINYKISLNLLFVVLLYLIMISRLIVFFLFYEMVFILIIFVIILLGYSYERLIAAFLIMFYSFLFSSPVLIILLLFDHRFLIKNWLSYSVLINCFFVGSFIVKFPIFGVHYWLPVAHVEASTVGSILLAGVLLKLGSVGLLYVITYLCFIIKLHWLRLRVILLILMIVSLRDLKIIIAYSSVAHMSIVFYIIILGYRVGKKGAIYIIFYHGFISPLMFWVVGLLAWWKTRSLIVIKLISFSSIFIFILFFLFILNIGFPPFMGFMSEVLILKSLVNTWLVLRVIILGVLFSCYYNVYLFWCFTGFIGMVFKLNFFSVDLFLFLLFAIVLNFYWVSIVYGILWLCRYFNGVYVCDFDFFINIISIIRFNFNN
jgi:NADH:ubiquinone oxidoreductase subunit 4 (subunit M)